MRIALVGFGQVGRRFAKLLPGPYAAALRAPGARPRVTGIATGSHGRAIDPRGLDLRRCLRLAAQGALDVLHRGAPLRSTADFIRQVPADVLLELTPLDARNGEPAIGHVRLALRRDLHVITANKGPVAFALSSLRSLARKHCRLFLHEGAVMDGAPIFNLVQRCLPGLRVLGFRGVLNATTTRILARMEQGVSAADALREAQALGIAEADPRNDLDGWDAAMKGCALANALMRASLNPSQVRRRGIGGVTAQAVRAAVAAGQRVRLVVRGSRARNGIRVSVAPERLALDDLLASTGCDGVLVLETDLMGEIGIWEGPASPDQTAYALLADLVTVASAGRLERGRTRRALPGYARQGGGRTA